MVYYFLFFYTLLISNFSFKSTNSNYVTFEQFGFKNNGTNETHLMINALLYAKQNKLPIKLLDKTYRFSPKETINITGIPKIFGSGTFDLTNTGPNAGNTNQKAIFHIEGQKKLIKPYYNDLKKGAIQLLLDSFLYLKPGDILFITSSESLPNDKRPYYCKGQRISVKSYNNKTGILLINKPINYNFKQSFIWHHSMIPEITIGEDISFITSPMNFTTCFRLFYAKGNISGHFKNFAHTSIMFKSSFGNVRNMQADLPVNVNNGYSYCIEVSDMSDVKIYNCSLSGGRHVITSGGGGLWKKEESGGSGAAGYPSFVFIDGGIYKGTKGVNDINSNNATIDSHGLTETMTIQNALIYGGVNLGANYVTIKNTTIYSDDKRLLNVGSDVVANADWGHYFIQNCTFVADTPNETGSLILCKGGINSLFLENILLVNLKPNIYLMDGHQFSPKRTVFKNVTFKSSTPQENLIISKPGVIISIKNSDFQHKNIKKI
jgi:hypothetical protein